MKVLALALGALASAVFITSRSLTRRADCCGQWDNVTEVTLFCITTSGARTRRQRIGFGQLQHYFLAHEFELVRRPVQRERFRESCISIHCNPIEQSGLNPNYLAMGISHCEYYQKYLRFIHDFSPENSSEYEIMIWLAALGGAGPISSTGSAIASVTLGGVSWGLWYGLSLDMQVYSFVVSPMIESFSVDLIDFINYLEDSQGFPSGQYLTHVQLAQSHSPALMQLLPFPLTPSRFVNGDVYTGLLIG